MIYNFISLYLHNKIFIENSESYIRVELNEPIADIPIVGIEPNISQQISPHNNSNSIIENEVENNLNCFENDDNIDGDDDTDNNAKFLCKYDY